MTFEQLMEEARVLYKRSNKKLEYLIHFASFLLFHLFFFVLFFHFFFFDCKRYDTSNPLEDEVDEHLLEKWGPFRSPSPPPKGTVLQPDIHSNFSATLATIELTLPHGMSQSLSSFPSLLCFLNNIII